MKRVRILPILAVLVMAAGAILGGQVQQQERVDLDAIYKIKDEGFLRSHVMEITSYLTDVYGPRLTNSPNIKAAAKWAASQMTQWGLTGVKEEPWGPFGRGWSNEKTYVQAVSPQPFPIIALPKAWTPGTGGPLRGEATMAIIGSEQDVEKYRGKLRGKFVLTSQAVPTPPAANALSTKYDEKALEQLAQQPPPNPGRRGGGPGGQNAQNLNRVRTEFFTSEGIAATLEPSRGVNGGTIFVQSPPGPGGRGNPMGVRDPKAPKGYPQLVLAAEHYNRIVRMLDKKVAVTLEMDVENRYYDDTLDSFNLVGEIRGTDLADEVVMLGAHFDSWHGGTGATDNAAGSAVMLEAMRILKATGLKLRRTVRVALWTGEEQGLYGSRAYVKDHFGDRETMTLRPDHSKLSVYFNVDNGTGAIRGIYMQRNEAVAPIFQAWMEPFRNAGMTTSSIRNTGSTDHVPFDEVGLPAFQFIQDPVEYDTRTHHSNMDTYDRIQASDMMQNAAIVASFAYHAANRDQKLPRKPLPASQPAK
jgi:hypothetical protein